MARIGWSIWRPINESTGQVQITADNPWICKGVLVMDPLLAQAAVAGDKKYITYAAAVAQTVNEDHYTDFEPRMSQTETWGDVPVGPGGTLQEQADALWAGLKDQVAPLNGE